MDMAEPKDPTPYPVEPEPEGGPARPRPRIDEPGLLEGFDEDVDLTSDPELEASIIAGARPPAPGTPGGATAAPKPEPPPHGPVMVRAGGVSDRVWLIAAGVALLLAITEALIWQEQGRWAHVGLTIYGALLNTGLGLAAIYMVARLLERPLGAFERAGARVALAACLWQVAAQLQIPLVGESRIEELILAVAIYTLVLWGLFRWDGRTLGFVLGLHFGGWLLIQAGSELQSCATRAAAAS